MLGDPIIRIHRTGTLLHSQRSTGKELTVQQAIIHPNIRKIEKTASSAEIGKYLLIVDRYMKEQAENYIDEVLALLPELENQPANFKKPQRGGNAFKKARINNISNFLNKLEEQIDNENLMYADDDEDTTPPPRPKRFTISYAQAAKILNPASPQATNKLPTNQVTTTETTTTTTSTITQESLEEALQKF
jgi:hypothetical protein